MVSLHPVALEHAAALQPLLEDPLVSDPTPIAYPYPPDGARSFAAQAVAHWAAGTQYCFTVREADGQPIGVTLLKDVHQVPGEAELGYWLGRPWWGGGRATTAAALTLDFAFGVLDLRGVRAVCLAQNPASLRVLAKLGFGETGRGLQHLAKWAGPREQVMHYLERAAWPGPFPGRIGIS